MSERIKLGKIKNGKLKNFSDSITWDFDYTLLVFIRDGLKRFKELKTGIPAHLCYKYEQLGVEDPDAAAAQEYNSILDTIISNIEYYQSTDMDLLSPADKELYHNYLATYHTEKDERGYHKVKFAEQTEDIKRIKKELEEINIKQKQKIDEAFDLLKENLCTFWW